MIKLQFCRAEIVFGPFDAFLTVIGQISSSSRSLLLFLITEKGPRAAKISRRAACGPRTALRPCLVYNFNLD